MVSAKYGDRFFQVSLKIENFSRFDLTLPLFYGMFGDTTPRHFAGWGSLYGCPFFMGGRGEADGEAQYRVHRGV